MYRIDEKQFLHYLNQFCILARAEQIREDGTDELSFSKGFLYDQEGYKYEIPDKAQKILEAESWVREDVGTGKIVSKVKAVFNPSLQNIVDWREVSYAEEIMDKNLKRAEIVLFNLFCDGEEEDSFNAAIDLFGNRYPLITFLFYIKDSKKYVPVKPVPFKERLDLLGFSTHSLNLCTWKNYSEFLEILCWVQKAITPFFDKVTLIDAHSFVWMMWMLIKPQGSPEWFYDRAQTPEASEYSNNIESLRERFIDSFAPDKLSVMSGQDLLKNVFSNRPSSMMYLLMNDGAYRNFGATGQYKYLQVVYQGIDGEWYYKESVHPELLSPQEAEKKAEWVRNQILYCAEQIETIEIFQTIQDYETLQNLTEKVFFYKFPWMLKYYQMIYPQYFPGMYADKTLERALHILGLPNHEKRLLNAGEISLFIRRCDVNNIVFNKIYSDEWGWDEDRKPCKNATQNYEGSKGQVNSVNTKHYQTPTGSRARKEVLVSKAKAIDDELNSLHLEGREKEAIVKVRVNQGEFRNKLLNKYGKCCLCGVSDPMFLIASHIKPWAKSEPLEKLDPDNGLLLCPNHDKLFDKGLITFDESGKIMISKKLAENDRTFMNIGQHMRLKPTEAQAEFLNYHRNHVFVDSKG